MLCFPYSWGHCPLIMLYLAETKKHNIKDDSKNKRLPDPPSFSLPTTFNCLQKNLHTLCSAALWLFLLVAFFATRAFFFFLGEHSLEFSFVSHSISLLKITCVSHVWYYLRFVKYKFIKGCRGKMEVYIFFSRNSLSVTRILYFLSFSEAFYKLAAVFYGTKTFLHTERTYICTSIYWYKSVR